MTLLTPNIFITKMSEDPLRAIIAGTSGQMAISENYVSWTNIESSFGTDAIRKVASGNGVRVAISPSGKVATSVDGITWSQETTSISGMAPFDMIFANGKFTAVGNGYVSHSLDGKTWGTPIFVASQNFTNVCYGNGQYLVSGMSNTVYTSSDGLSWTTRSTGLATSQLFSSTFGNGIYMICGANGLVATSPDLITWTSRSSGFGSDTVTCSLYADGTYLIGGTNGKLSSSTNLSSWTPRSSGFGAETIDSISHARGTYLIGGTNGRLSSSTNLSSWTSLSSAMGTSRIFTIFMR